MWVCSLSYLQSMKMCVYSLSYLYSMEVQGYGISLWYSMKEWGYSLSYWYSMQVCGQSISYWYSMKVWGLALTETAMGPMVATATLRASSSLGGSVRQSLMFTSASVGLYLHDVCWKVHNVLKLYLFSKHVYYKLQHFICLLFVLSNKK